MSDLLAFAVGINQVGLPALGLLSLVASKLCHGRQAALADRTLLSVLALVILMTFHSLMMENRNWMLHAITLGTMMVGAVWEPRTRTSTILEE
jgi:uncharacterized BrkB/YihY/UPF0761 family membrane protein